jgi:hypothetical protein
MNRGYATGCNDPNKSHRDDRFCEREVLTPCDYEQYSKRRVINPMQFYFNAMFKK